MAITSYYQVIASLPGSKTKTIINKSESQAMEYVISFLNSSTIKENWGSKAHSYQVYELKIYKTKTKYSKKTGKKIEEFLKGVQNTYYSFEKRAKQLLHKDDYRVFINMPIQGKELGSQNEQRIFKEFDSRFNKIKDILSNYNAVAIRIDKEFPLEQLVARIKSEIETASFMICDLTEERPSCYFEAGYAEAIKKKVIYIASEFSIIDTTKKTNIHFDIHMNVNFFSNIVEMASKIVNVIEKNKETLFKTKEEVVALT